MSRVGAVIGRFQTDDLTEGHLRQLKAASAHNHMLVLIGVPKITGTKKDPMDFETRKLMIQDKFPRAICLPLFNKRSDDKWSAQVDNIIGTLFPKENDVVIYHGRDSFKKSYSGVYTTEEIESIPHMSATDLRNSVRAVNSTDFRRGVIHSCNEKPITVIPLVNVLIYQNIIESGDLCAIEILCVKMSDSKKFSLPVDKYAQGDPNVFVSALRILMEKMGITLTEIEKGNIRIANQLMVESPLNSEDVKHVTTLLTLKVDDIRTFDPSPRTDVEEVITLKLRFSDFDSYKNAFEIEDWELLSKFKNSLLEMHYS